VKQARSELNLVRRRRVDNGCILHVKDAAGQAMGYAIFREVRYAWRVILRAHGTSVLLVLILALGIGAATAMFSVIDGVILRPLPYPHAERIMVIGGASAPPSGDRLGWWGQSKAFEELAIYRSGGVNLTGGSQPERVPAAAVSGAFFDIFGTRPTLGRAFAKDEQLPARNRVALLSHQLWTENFGRDSQILGRTIKLNGLAHQIVGVLPTGFSFPGHTDIWVPERISGPQGGGDRLDLGPNQQPDVPSFLAQAVIGRLGKGATVAHAHSELALLLSRLNENFSGKTGIHYGDTIGVTPLQEVLVRGSRVALFTLFASVLLLLLVACVNAASILLSRAGARQKEIALRLCLGASRIHIIRHSVMEGLLLAFFGGLLGIACAYWIVAVIRVIGPADITRLAESGENLRVLTFMVTVTLSTGFFVGFIPAFDLLVQDIPAALQRDGFCSASRFGPKARGVLASAEIGLTLVVLVGAGLMIRSLERLTRVEPGFNPRNLVVLELSLPQEKYSPETGAARAHGMQPSGNPSHGGTPVTGPQSKQDEAFEDQDAMAATFCNRFEAAIGGLPGVTAVGFIDRIPLGGETGWYYYLDVDGKQSVCEANTFRVGGEYFKALGIPLLAGRSFREGDIRRAPRVAIVNLSMARRLWGHRDPLGRQFVMEGERVPREVVGVVADVKFSSLGEQPEPQIYLPFRQPYNDGRTPLNLAFTIRTGSDPRTMIPLFRRQLVNIDKDLPVSRANTMEELVYESASALRFRGILLGMFSLFAMILAVAGVYGVVAETVRLRTQEIGVRISLGAAEREILRFIVSQGARIALCGVVVGVIVALGITRLSSGLLYDVSPTDPVTFLFVSATLIIAALLASYFPARKVAKLDPVAALRHE
jgi:putative ABC transport system permease protein